MINSKSDYKYYFECDKTTNGIKNGLATLLINPQYRYLKTLRKAEYVANCKRGVLGKIQGVFLTFRLIKLQHKFGWVIPINVADAGLSLAHVGPIIINPSARIGRNCRIHVGVNIGTKAGFGDLAPTIGDNCYIGPGAKLFGDIVVGNNVAIGANAVVNKSFRENDITVAGVPAKVISHKGSKGLLITAGE